MVEKWDPVPGLQDPEIPQNPRDSLGPSEQPALPENPETLAISSVCYT